jgi:Mrp family chromosome partitioning ATPase
MGEIADALKKATAEKSAEAPPPSPVSGQAVHPAPPPQTQAALTGSADSPPTSVAAPLIAVDEGRLPEIETHRQLALRVRSELDRNRLVSLAVVSALRDEGKTMVACTLAMALASISPDRSVALVDLDLRNPSVGHRLDLPVRTGLESVLRGQASLDEVRISIERPMLDVYPTLQPQPGAHELLAGPSFARTLEALEARYATVIIDTPPTLMVPDASLILSKGPACVPVARIGTSRVRRFQQMLQVLPDAQVIGKIVNGATIKKHERGYYYYGKAENA